MAEAFDIAEQDAKEKINNFTNALQRGVYQTQRTAKEKEKDSQNPAEKDVQGKETHGQMGKPDEGREMDLGRFNNRETEEETTEQEKGEEFNEVPNHENPEEAKNRAPKANDTAKENPKTSGTEPLYEKAPEPVKENLTTEEREPAERDLSKFNDGQQERRLHLTENDLSTKYDDLSIAYNRLGNPGMGKECDQIKDTLEKIEDTTTRADATLNLPGNTVTEKLDSLAKYFSEGTKEKTAISGMKEFYEQAEITGRDMAKSLRHPSNEKLWEKAKSGVEKLCGINSSKEKEIGENSRKEPERELNNDDLKKALEKDMENTKAGKEPRSDELNKAIEKNLTQKMETEAEKATKKAAKKVAEKSIKIASKTVKDTAFTFGRAACLSNPYTAIAYVAVAIAVRAVKSVANEGKKQEEQGRSTVSGNEEKSRETQSQSLKMSDKAQSQAMDQNRSQGESR